MSTLASQFAATAAVLPAAEFVSRLGALGAVEYVLVYDAIPAHESCEVPLRLDVHRFPDGSFLTDDTLGTFASYDSARDICDVHETMEYPFIRAYSRTEWERRYW